MYLTIVIPTYKERENLPELFDRIFKVFDQLNGYCEIIIVDDNSNDGTKEYANKIWRHPVTVLVRKHEKGLATACVLGFKHAKGNKIIVMDGDLQHPPEKILEMVSKLENSADVVIGSRYFGDGTAGSFGLKRKIISKGAGLLFNSFFPDIKTTDTQSGFFGFRKKVIKNVDLKPRGYKILLEILVHGNYKKIEEIGFTFGERQKGKSKLGFFTIFSYLSHLYHLLWSSGKMKTMLQFFFVGFTGVFVNLGSLYIFTNMGLYYVVSGVIAVELSLITNFLINRFWTFKKEAKTVKLFRSLYRDHLIRSIGILIKISCLFILTEIFGLFYIISMLIGIGIATMWNFLGNIRWVWKK